MPYTANWTGGTGYPGTADTANFGDTGVTNTTITASGTTPITFSAAPLPPGLTMYSEYSDSKAELLAGTTALVSYDKGVPAITVFGWLVTILAENYRMLTFLELLPFP